MSGKRSRRLVLFGLLAVVLLVAAFHQQILLGMGTMLVNAGPPRKADIVVVLGGDWRGNRILKGAELARQGYAPLVLASGSGGMYGHREADMAIDYAVEKGYPRGSFIRLDYPALNTVDESLGVLRELRKRGIHRMVLVTSEFHTGRAGRIFRREAPDMEITVVASASPEWGGGEWWKNREGQKLWLAEFEKSIADFFRI